MRGKQVPGRMATRERGEEGGGKKAKVGKGVMHLIGLGGETGNAQAVVDDEVANHASLFQWNVFGHNRRIPIPAHVVPAVQTNI